MKGEHFSKSMLTLFLIIEKLIFFSNKPLYLSVGGVKGSVNGNSSDPPIFMQCVFVLKGL